MIEEKKKIEYWNFLTTEKNQPRPKEITAHRLAVIKPLVIESNVWQRIIGQAEISNQAAAKFFQSESVHSKLSRTVFWQAVRAVITQEESDRAKTAGREREPTTAIIGKKSFRRRSRG